MPVDEWPGFSVKAEARANPHLSAKKKAGYPLEIGRQTGAAANFIFKSTNR